MIAWAVVAVALLGLIGSVGIGEPGGALVWMLVGAVAGGYLLAARRRRAAAAAAVIAARADRENELYLGGDAAGMYGQFRPGH